MALPQKIAEALERIHKKIEEKGGSHVLHTSEIDREDRELLKRTLWLEEISRGWYLVTRPDVPVGDSTPWYASFWDFLKTYLSHHHGSAYCINAEGSIGLHFGNLTIPKQVIVIAKKASGTPLALPYDTSLLVYADPERLPNERSELYGLQVMNLPYALCRVGPRYFINSPREAELALQSILDVSGFLKIIIRHNLKTAAERLIGAYRFLGKEKMAKDLENGLLTAGMIVKGENPFTQEAPLLKVKKFRSPHALRIEAMWASFRPVVRDHFPAPSPLQKNSEGILKQIQELYVQDAYHSLSIEGYQVTKQLLERVQNGLWNPDNNLQDTQQRNVLAARGYFEAFQQVKESIAKILNGQHPGEVMQDDLPVWFQHLFGPSVHVGLLGPSDLYGWRRHQVYIRSSRHTPPSPVYLMDAMETFFQCLQNEEYPSVRAILGHFMFVFIHPYMDGNGRIARFLMNSMFISGGYPWTIIPVERRNEYFMALESASVGANIIPFTKFVHEVMQQNLPKL